MEDSNVDRYEEFILNDEANPDREVSGTDKSEHDLTEEPTENCFICKESTCICRKSDQIYTPEISLLEDGEIDSPDKILTDNDETKLVDSILSKRLDETQKKPKPLLGKAIAQRRLQAFSLQKRVLEKISPLLQKAKKAANLQVSIEPTYDEGGDVIDDLLICKPQSSRAVTPKKISRPEERSGPWRGRHDGEKTYPRFLTDRRPVDRYRRYGDRRNWDRRDRSHERPAECIDRNVKPVNWDDYKRHLDTYGSYQRKRTVRAPHVTYCGNLQHTTKLYPSRQEFLDLIPQKRATIVKNFLKSCTDDPKFLPLYPKTQEWYSKEHLAEETKKPTQAPKTEEETPTLSKSYGLSVLSESYQNHWDEESESGQKNMHDDLTPGDTLGDLTPVVEPDTCDEMVDTPEEIETPEKLEEEILEEQIIEDDKKIEVKKLEEKKTKKVDNKNEDKKSEVKTVETKKVELKKRDDKKNETKKVEGKEDPSNTPTVQTPNTDEYRSNWEDEEDYLGDFKSPNYEKVWDSDDNNSILSRKASKKFNRYSNKKDVTIADISYNEKKDLTNGLSDSFINSFGYRRSESKEDETPEPKRRRISKKKKKSKRKSKESGPKISLNSLVEEIETKQNSLREKRPNYDSEFITKHEWGSRKTYWDNDEDTLYKANRREENWEQNRYWNNSYDINEFRMKEKEGLDVVIEEKKSPKITELKDEVEIEDLGQNSQTASKLVSEYEEFMKTVGVDLALEVSNHSKGSKKSISDKSSVKSDKVSVKSDKLSVKSDKQSVKSNKSDKSRKKKRKASTSSDDSKSKKRKRRSKSKKKARKVKKAKKKRKISTSSSSSSSSSSESSSETISSSTSSSSNNSIIEPSQIKIEKVSDEEKEPTTILNIKKEILDETETKKPQENPDFFNTFNLNNIENDSFEKLERQRQEIVESLKGTEPTETISSTISVVQNSKEPSPPKKYESKKRLSPSELNRYNHDYKYRSSSRRSDYSRRRYDSKYYRSRRSRSPLNRPRDYSSNSPLDGFKRSVADSTISDSELVQSMNQEPSGGVKKDRLSELKRTSSSSPSVDSPLSPKRLSLDDRINQFLGIDDKKPQKPYYAYNNSTENYYDQGYYPEQQYDAYPQQNYYPAPATPRYQSQVLQVGNVLQVVPSEMPAAYPPQLPQLPVKKEEDCTKSKVVQVGNMLQIVPTETLPELPKPKAIIPNKPKPPVQPKSSPVAPPPPPPPPPKKDIVQEYIRETNAILKAEDSKKATLVLVNEIVEKQRKIEKEKRHAEREERRKEREIKRAEKEKRKDRRIKIKTEKMIKRALLLDTPDNIDAAIIDISEMNEDDETTASTTAMWPPPGPLPVCLDLPSKGILVKTGFRKIKTESELMIEDIITASPEEKSRKTVRFADGIPPGEGTSPSAGEDLPSPPPPKRKMPKEERYKKTKMRPRKKVKVKVIRPVQVPVELETEDSDDNLPPPPPPPGSPPPHLWPPNYNKPVEPPPFVASPFPTFPNGTHLPPPGFLPAPSPNSNMMIPPPILNSLLSPSMKPPLLNFRPPMPRFGPDGTISQPPPCNKMFLPDRRHYPIT